MTKILTILLSISFFQCSRAPKPLPLSPGSPRTLHRSVSTIRGSSKARAWVGTAFAISKNLLITAEHVCRDALSLKLIGSSRAKVKALMVDKANDLCLLEGKHGLNPLPASYKDPRMGDRLYIYGSPSGIPNILTEGYDAGTIDIPGWGERRVSSAPAHGGNSGGPVLNSSGAVVGVLVMGHPQYSHVTFYTDRKHIFNMLEKAKVEYE